MITYYWVILDPKSKEDKVKVTNFKNSPKFQIFELWNKQYTWHTFWSCVMRCANIKWIWQVLLKIQSGHDSVHRRTDGRTDGRTNGQGETSIPRFQLRWSGGYNDGKFTDAYMNHSASMSQISLKFVSKGPIDNKTALDEVMAWRRIGDKPSLNQWCHMSIKVSQSTVN